MIPNLKDDYHTVQKVSKYDQSNKDKSTTVKR
jgi:hypothetical protein